MYLSFLLTRRPPLPSLDGEHVGREPRLRVAVLVVDVEAQPAASREERGAEAAVVAGVLDHHGAAGAVVVSWEEV